MLAVITGGSGFLARKLSLRLLEKGYSVRCLVRRMGATPHVAEKETFTLGDLGDCDSLKRAFEGAQVVFHTAGLISYNPAKNDLMVATNVVGTRHVVQAALSQGVPRLVHTSSTAAIGVNEDPGVLLDEESPFNARKLKLAYFDTKYDAEKEVWEGVSKGLSAVVVNPGSLLGPGDTRRYEKSYPGLIYKYKPPLLFHGGINFVDVSDAVSGHLLAMELGKSGQRYILGGENLSFADFIRRTNAILGRPSPERHLPKSMMSLAANALKVLNKLGVDLHMTPELVRQVTSWFLYVSSKKAERELGYRPKRIDQSISATIQWLKEEGRIQ